MHDFRTRPTAEPFSHPSRRPAEASRPPPRRHSMPRSSKTSASPTIRSTNSEVSCAASGQTLAISRNCRIPQRVHPPAGFYNTGSERTMNRLGVVGCGVMGAGIAEVGAKGGCDVVVVDFSDVILDGARGRMAVSLAKAETRGQGRSHRRPRPHPLRRGDYRDKHVVHPRRADRSSQRPPKSGPRPALLQPGPGHATGRGGGLPRH